MDGKPLDKYMLGYIHIHACNNIFIWNTEICAYINIDLYYKSISTSSVEMKIVDLCKMLNFYSIFLHKNN